MAIRIIKPGVVPNDLFRGSCFRCKCEIHCKATDGRYSSATQREGAFVQVGCPTEGCNATLTAYPVK